MKKGVILVEVLIAAGILGAIMVPIIGFFVTSLETNWFATREVKASLLIQEEIEAVRSIRERNWEELVNGDYYVTFSGGRWRLVTSVEGETISGFTRKINISPVYRNSNGQIVAEGGGSRLDPSTKKLTAVVSWEGLRARSLSSLVYLTRYLDNLTWIQTTKADFDGGTKELVKTIDPPQVDGEVVLMGGCPSGSPEALIYDDMLRNGWVSKCSAIPTFWERLWCTIFNWLSNLLNNGNVMNIANTSPTYNGSSNSIELTFNPPGWSWAGIYNYKDICTIGFKNLHFYAYNSSAQPVTLYVTASYGSWDRRQVVLPPGGWTEVTLDYSALGDGYETNLKRIFFSVNSPSSQVKLYLDQIELTGGVGGYFTEGSLSSSYFDAGRETAFNQIFFEANLLAQTEIGFQVATSNSAVGPWIFYGPGGTTSTGDLYRQSTGEGIWLGNNFGRYAKYKAYLRSFNGVSTPTLYQVGINYSP